MSTTSQEDIVEHAVRNKELLSAAAAAAAAAAASSSEEQQVKTSKVTTGSGTADQPYSVFSKWQKIVIVAISAGTGLISPLSANMYLPALPEVEKDLNATTELVNITVTVYMVFQGLSPTFWGSLADRWGRRPVILGTMAVYVGANIGLALAPSYAALMVLRMLQAFGSSSVIAVGAGIIGDVAAPAERGSYFGVYTTAQTIGPVIGPVLGGIIAETLSWRWVFWVLLIFAGALFVVTFMFLPETLRSLVGNGSGYASPTPIQWAKRQISGQTAPSPASSWKRFMSLPNFLEPLKYFLEADLAAVLLYLALHYAVYTAVLISMSSMFADLYGLNQLQVGLCYLVQGFGCILGSFSAGRLLDHDYRVLARKRGLDAESKKGAKISLDFPIYWARLRTTWIQSGVIQIVTIIYGWMLWIHAHLAVPLILQFFMGFSLIGIFNGIQTLLVDLFPGKGASISASNNLARCILGAILSVVIEPGFQNIGAGWMFTIFTIILLLSNSSILFVLKFGPRWRTKRAQAAEEKMLNTSMQIDSSRH